MQTPKRLTQHPPHRGPLLLAIGLVLLLLTVLLALVYVWNGSASPPVDPYARYRVALKEDAQTAFEKLGVVPRYEIDVTLDESLELLYGSAQIVVPNTSPDPWTYLIFRLYPGLEHYGGLLSIQSATVNGRTVPFSYLERNTALRVELPTVLLSGQQANLYLSWKLDIPQWKTDSALAYRLFGHSQEMVSLPLFYPSLAVYEPGPTVASGRWWLERGTSRGDAAFNLTSLFVVTTTLPADQIPVTSGTLITNTVLETGENQFVWTTGPAREFLLHTSNRFQQATVEAYGTRITSYWLPEYEPAGRAALQHTAAALRIYSDRFGPYPYSDLRVAMAPISIRGMEYPQVSLLGVQLYGQYRNELEIRTAHEVAHQWWYQLVHNDPVNLPWMDEGLAEYSSKLYYEAMRGQSVADLLQLQRWQAVIDGLVSRGEDAPINQPVMAYANSRVYESVVYGKGALFYAAIRQSLGDRQFDQFLRDYVDEYSHRIATPEDLLTLLRRYNPQVADSLYRTWIGELPIEITETN
ncbi:MAG: M1 family metallopeptidase [Caldilineaceae bacterium]|nr:M1 family metallopeptidase [Caldilineaceae bacterium]